MSLTSVGIALGMACCWVLLFALTCCPPVAPVTLVHIALVTSLWSHRLTIGSTLNDELNTIMSDH